MEKKEMDTLEKWLDNYSKPIERFAFQNGCTPEQAALVAEEACKAINENSDEPLVSTLYKNVIDALANMERTVELPDGTFPFEEDAALHLEIKKLDEDNRLPLILSLFHKLKVEEIALILDCSEMEVESKIQAAKELLTGEHLEKRLEFLGKSYDRLPVLFNLENITRKTTNVESLAEVKERKTTGRKGPLMASILGILLIGLLVGNYFTSEERGLKSDQKYIESIKVDFAEKASERQEILGVNEEVVDSIPFIEKANKQYDGLIQDLEKMIEENERINRSDMEEQLSNLSFAMKLPSELADDLFKSPLTADAEKSIEFINEYIERVYQVLNSIYEQFSEEFDQLNGSTTDEIHDLDLILSNEGDYSEGLRMGIQVLVSQNINLNWGFYLVKGSIDVKEDNFFERLQTGLHESASGYVLSYTKQPFISNEKLIYSLDETVGFIKEMETTLHADRDNGEMKNYLESTMIGLLGSIVFGMYEEPLWNSSGSISEVYRNAWKRLASFGNESVVSEIMTKIIDEMELSDWTQSTVYTYLTSQEYRIFEAYSLAKEGDLDSFSALPAGINELYEARVTQVPSLERSMETLYKEFSVTYDRQALKYVHPLLILGLYDYANAMENPEMMWHLTDYRTRILYVEDYTEGWKPEPSILEKTESIGYNPSLVINNSEKVMVPIEFVRDGSTYYNAWMSYADDDVWQIESIVRSDILIDR